MEIKIDMKQRINSPKPQTMLLQDKLISNSPAVSKPPSSSKLTTTKTVASSPPETIKDIFTAIDSLIGLDEVKGMIYEIHAFTEVQKRRQKEQLAAEPTVLHAIFRGNPGSGKTTLARYLARLYKEMGILSKGHLIEVERADLVGEFVGHTAQKTKEQVKKSLGGLLFIDEAYSLCRGGEKDFGREAIDVLVKAMEDHKNDFVLVLAGYNKEMDQFLRSNPGLYSRFPLHIDFPDYTQRQLLDIAAHMYGQREYQLSQATWRELERFLLLQMAEKATLSGNARTVRNIVEASLRTQAVRLTQRQDYSLVNRNELQEISPADLALAIKRLPLQQNRELKKAGREAGHLAQLNA